MKRLHLAAGLLLAACGGTGLTTIAGQSSSCTVTLSGALTGTYDCKPATAAWSSSSSQGGFAFNVSQAGSAPAISLAIGWPGEPKTGTYANTDAGAQGAVSVQIPSGASAGHWVAAAGSGSAQGSYSLKFTSVSNTLSASNVKAYSTEGTLDATLPAVSGTGATGTITQHATF